MVIFLIFIVDCRPQIVTLLTVLGAPQSEVNDDVMMMSYF